MSYLITFCLITLNRVKLGRAVTFIKYFASVVSLTFLPKSLIWNKITLPASNSLYFTELRENELMKSISKKFYQCFSFYPIYRCLLTKELDNFTKILISIVFYWS